MLNKTWTTNLFPWAQ